MKPHTRRAIAFIVSSIFAKKKYSSIFDFASSQYYNFSGSVSETGVNIFDFDQGCYVTGSLASVFHFGNAGYISINLRGNRFSGFDYDTGSHFTGELRSGAATLFDYGLGTYFQYSI